jgi:hypothetical protein
VTALTGLTSGEFPTLQQLVTGLLGIKPSSSDSFVAQLVSAIGGSGTELSDITTFINDLLGAFGGSSTVTEVETFITDLSAGVGGLAQNIIDTLVGLLGGSGAGNSLATLSTVFAEFTSASSQLGTEMTQLGQIFDQQVVTPISEAVSQAQTGFNNLVTKLTLMFRTPNMVLDPDFEVAAMWSNAAGTQTTNESHSGIYSWQLVGQG